MNASYGTGSTLVKARSSRLGQPQGDGLVDVSDVLCAMDSFGNLSNCAAADQQPCTQIDGSANLDDLLTVMSAFTGESFAVTCAAAYPPCNEPTPTIRDEWTYPANPAHLDRSWHDRRRLSFLSDR